MGDYAVIVQNDESKWNDVKGDSYNYPNSYRNILTRGCKVIYYKGGLKNKIYQTQRLSDSPHYFGVGVIGDSIPDPNNEKKEFYCQILDYQEFEKPVLSKINNEFLESIPESKKSNYWRFGVREITKEVYDSILIHAQLKSYEITLPNENADFESYQEEGGKKQRYSTYYERNPYYRNKALEIHGYSCMVCSINFERDYGEIGKGFIHVHHNKPLFKSGPTKINPITDLSVLCPNCHAMIHRKKSKTLTVEELRIIRKANSAK